MKELTPVSKVQSSVPAYLQSHTPTMTDINLKEIKIPMIKAGQYMSDEVKTGKVKYGEIYSTVGDMWGKELEMVIIKPFINYIIFEKGKLAGRSSNGISWEEGSLAGQSIDQDLAFKYKRYNFYVLPLNTLDPLPYCLSMYSSSGAKEGQKLYNLLAISMLKEKVPCYAKVYKITTKEDKNDQGEFASWKIEQKPGFASEPLANIAEEARKFIDINESLIKVEEEPVVSHEAKKVTEEKADY